MSFRETEKDVIVLNSIALHFCKHNPLDFKILMKPMFIGEAAVVDCIHSEVLSRSLLVPGVDVNPLIVSILVTDVKKIIGIVGALSNPTIILDEIRALEHDRIAVVKHQNEVPVRD